MPQTKTLRKGDFELSAWKYGKKSPTTFERNPINEGWTDEKEVRTRARELDSAGYKVHVSKLTGFMSLPGMGRSTVSEEVFTSKGFYDVKTINGEFVYFDKAASYGLTNRGQSSITKDKSGEPSFKTPHQNNEAQTAHKGNKMTEQNTTDTTAPKATETPLTIPQKVEALQAEKVRLTGELNDADETAKPALQERINVIDRKVRWYAGRSKESAARPSTAGKSVKAAKPAKVKAAKPVQAEQPAPVTAANES